MYMLPALKQESGALCMGVYIRYKQGRYISPADSGSLVLARQGKWSEEAVFKELQKRKTLKISDTYKKQRSRKAV